MGGTRVSQGAEKLTVAWPLLVARLREAVPPRTQTWINSFTDAVRKSEISLADIFNEVSVSESLEE